jgi:ribonuclease Z
MRLCFLGTGGSWPTRDRNTVCVALTHSRDTILLDCGEGTQRQMMDSPVSPHRIAAILVSHLHGDHVLGIPGLVQSMSLNGREHPLRIIGPAGTAESVKRLLTATIFSSGFDVEVLEISKESKTKVGELEIDCANSCHGLDGLAFRIRTPMRPGKFDREKAISMGIPEGKLWGKLQRGETVTYVSDGETMTADPGDVVGKARKGITVVYSGDTAPCKAVEELAGSADVLIHEATYSERLSSAAEEYGHSTAKGAAALAARAGVRKLFLVHTSPRYSDPISLEELTREARAEFPGAIVPSDLDCFEIAPST